MAISLVGSLVTEYADSPFLVVDEERDRVYTARVGGGTAPAAPDHYWPLTEVGSNPRTDTIGGLVLNSTNTPLQTYVSTDDPAMGGFGISLGADNASLYDTSPADAEYVIANTSMTYAFWFKTAAPNITATDTTAGLFNLGSSPFTTRWQCRYVYNSGDPYFNFNCIDAGGTKVVGAPPDTHPDLTQAGKWFCILFGHDADNDRIFIYVGDRETGNTHYSTQAIDSGGLVGEVAATDSFQWPNQSADWGQIGGNASPEFCNHMIWNSALTETECAGYFNNGEGWKPEDGTGTDTLFASIDITNRNLPTVDYTTVVNNATWGGILRPADGFIYKNEIWVSGESTGTNSGIWILRRNDLEVREKIYDSANSGRNTSSVIKIDNARYKNYLYVPSDGSNYVGIIDMDKRSVVAEIVLPVAFDGVTNTTAEPLCVFVQGCWLYVGTESSGIYSYFLGNDPEDPDLGNWVDPYNVAKASGPMTPPNTAIDYTWSDGTIPQRTNEDGGTLTDVWSLFAIGDKLYAQSNTEDYYLHELSISDPLVMSVSDSLQDSTLEGRDMEGWGAKNLLYIVGEDDDHLSSVDIETTIVLEETSTDATRLSNVQTVKRDNSEYIYTVNENGAISGVSVWDSGQVVGSIYLPINILNYNDNPPPDDGSTTCDNLATWERPMEELFDPLKDAVKNLDRNINTAIIDTLRKIGVNKYSPGFSAYMSADQLVASDDWVKLEFDTEEFDNSGDFSTADSRFTPSERGKYVIGGYFQMDASSFDGNSDFKMAVYKNGERYRYLHNNDDWSIGGEGPYPSESGLCSVEANGCSDYFELFIFHATGDDAEQVKGGSDITTFWGYRAQ